MAGKPAMRRSKSVLLTTQEHFDEFIDSINSTSHSKTSGQGGARPNVPIGAKPA